MGLIEGIQIGLIIHGYENSNTRDRALGIKKVWSFPLLKYDLCGPLKTPPPTTMRIITRLSVQKELVADC